MKTTLTSLFACLPLLANALPTTNTPPRAALIGWDAPIGGTPTNYVVYASTNHFWVGTNMVLNPILVGQWNAGTGVSLITPYVLTLGSTYWFVVTAQYTNGESAYSAEASITVPPIYLPPPTLHITIQLVGSSTPVGPWEPIDLLADYLITPDCEYAFYRDVLTIHR